MSRDPTLSDLGISRDQSSQWQRLAAIPAERQAIEIRLRAERKCGEMLAGGAERADRGRPTKMSSETTLSDLNISRDQSSQWQKLAAIPADEFEADLADAMWRPTTSGLLERQDARERGPFPEPRGDEDALWLWGALIDVKERGLLARDQRERRARPPGAILLKPARWPQQLYLHLHL